MLIKAIAAGLLVKGLCETTKKILGNQKSSIIDEVNQIYLEATEIFIAEYRNKYEHDFESFLALEKNQLKILKSIYLGEFNLVEGDIDPRNDNGILDATNKERQFFLKTFYSLVDIRMNGLVSARSNLNKTSEISEVLRQIRELLVNAKIINEKEPQDIIDSFKIASSSVRLIPKTISGVFIEREEANDILEWLNKIIPVKRKGDNICYVTGRAGYGKSVILREVYEKLVAEGIPVIAIKADQKEAKSLFELTNLLNLDTDIVKEAKTAIQHFGTVVVLIDQIDALSQYMSKNRQTMNCYLEFIEVMSDINNVKIVVSCREFDLKHDQSLKRLDIGHKISVRSFTKDEVNKVIKAFNLNVNMLNAKLVALILIPSNLYLFVSLLNRTKSVHQINSYPVLFDTFWQNTIGNHTDKEILSKVIERVTESIKEQQSMSINVSPYFDDVIDGVKELSSLGILKNIENKVSFYHSSFYDYCFARKFIIEKNNLLDYILKSDQGLFIRSHVKMIIQYLRELDQDTYLNEVQVILLNENVYFHLKLLILEQIGYCEDVNLKDLTKFTIIVKKEINLELAFIDSIYSKAWMLLLIKQGSIIQWLKSEDKSIKHQVILKLCNFIKLLPEEISFFLNSDLKNILDVNEKYQIITQLDEWQFDDSLSLFLDIYHANIDNCKYLFKSVQYFN